MNEELANLVHPILSYGLDLKDRLDRGESPSLELEQAALKSLLLSDLEASRWIEYGGEVDADSLAAIREADHSGMGDDYFLGVRYALTCWLDELFILHSPWETQWNERKLELALYGTNDRAWRFWRQAGLAEGRPNADALEVYFLCVMLGFRGEMIDNPVQLRNWCKATQSKISLKGTHWPHPPEVQPPTNVPPLSAAERFRGTFYWTCVLLLLFIPLATFILMQRITE